MNKKSRAILEALTAGHSCEQILAGDGSLSYHDIFHAVTETPTSYWKKAPTVSTARRRTAERAAGRTPARQRSD